MSVDLRCCDAAELLRSIPSGSVEMIFTDPPYGHKTNADDLISRREAALGKLDYISKNTRPIVGDSREEADSTFRMLISEAARILVPGGVLCCCCGGGGPKPTFAHWSLRIDSQPGLNFVQAVVWDKGPIGMGWRYRRSYEFVLVAFRRGANMRWHDDSRRVENIIRPASGIKKIIPQSHQHPTEKPVSLASHFIRLHASPGDLVVDPFAGAGSTAIAAIGHGCRFLGSEIAPHWHRIAWAKIKNELDSLEIEKESCAA